MIVLTLLTDFGLSDSYVAQMKAVILSNVPSAQIIDISHGVQKHNVAMGSYLLETTVSFFPEGSIHVAVVDPGVGSSRKPVVVGCDRGILVGPDNGLLVRASERLGFQVAYEIKNGQFMRNRISHTFHGRDVFAFAAAKIAQGAKPDEVGPRVAKLVRLDFPDAIHSKNMISGIVLYIDSFGNVVTNITEYNSGKFGLREGGAIRLRTREGEHEGFVVGSYSDLSPDKIGVIVGSQGYLELALKNKSLAEMLNLKPSDRLEIRT